MRKNLCWLFLTTVFVLSIAMTNIGMASEEPVIRLEPHSNTAKVGETFTVNITVTDITEEESLYGWECRKITFNPKIINAINVTEGPFLKDTGYSTFFSNKINNTAGTVKALGMISEFPFPLTGASGSGTLATIIFKAVGQGPTGLEFGEEKNTELWTVVTGTGGKQTTTWFAHTAESASFNNGGLQIPLQYIAGIVVVIAVLTVAVFYFRRKRAQTRT